MPIAEPLLRRALRGHLAYEAATEGGWRLWRHSPTQVAAFAAQEGWATRCRCPAGIRLLLAPCGAWLELDWMVESQARVWGAVDLGPIGNPVLRQTATQIAVGEPWRIRFALPVELQGLPLECWLPHTQAGRLLDLRAAAPLAAAPEAAGRRRLLCLGDSITQGLVAAGPSGGWAMHLARLLDAELLNQGVGGHVFAAPSFAADLPWEPDLITVAYGTNDWSRGVDAAGLAAAAGAYLAAVRARYPRVPIALLTPIWRHDQAEDRAMPFAALAPALAAVAAQVPEVRVVDGALLAPHGTDRLPDGVHPDEAGMAVMAGNLYRVLRQGGLA